MNRSLLTKVFRDFRKTGAQTVALIAIVTIGIASFLAPAGAYRDLSASYERTYLQLNFADVTFSVKKVPPQLLSTIAGLKGISAVAGRSIYNTRVVLTQGGGTKQIRARMIGIPIEQRPKVDNILITNGRYFRKGDAQTAILETQFAEVYGLKTGDRITVVMSQGNVSFDVVGTAASPEYLDVVPSNYAIVSSARDFAVLFVPLPTLEKLTGQGINNVAVLLESGADKEQLYRKIQNLLSSHGLQGETPRKDQPSNAALQQDLKAYREVSRLMPAMILAVAAGSVFIMLSRLVRSQRQQVGLMKALGYADFPIVGQYLLAALIVGASGSAAGLAIGVPLQLWITRLYAQQLGIPLIQTRSYPDLIVEGVLISVVSTHLAGLFPALRSAGLPPASAMRPDVGAALPRGRRLFLERLFRLPRWLRLPMRNVFRIPRRFVTTSLGMFFAFIMILAPWGMLNSFHHEFLHTFNVVERWDIVATFNKPQSGSVLHRVQSFQGVATVTPSLQIPALIRYKEKNSDILLKALPAGQKVHHFQSAAGTTAEQAMREGKLVLSTGMLHTMGLKIGDQVSLVTPIGTHGLEVGSATDELLSTVGYISFSLVQKWVGLPVQMFNALYLTAHSSRAGAIRNDLYTLPDVTDVALKAGNERSVMSSRGLFHLFIGIILFFAGVVSFALLFNAMSINVLERRSELATMRAIGADRGGVSGLVLIENLLIWLLILVPGLLLGYWVTIQVGHTFRSEVFWFEIYIAPLSYVITSLAILATTLLASLPPLHGVNRMNLGEATKVQG